MHTIKRFITKFTNRNKAMQWHKEIDALLNAEL